MEPKPLELQILPPPEIKETRQQRVRRKRADVATGSAEEGVNAPEEEAAEEREPIPDAVFGPGYEAEPPPDETPLVNPPDKLDPAAKAGPPSLEEWQRFIGRVVLKLLTQGYLYLVLGDLEADLTPRERELIRLSPEDLMEMAAPFASFANKNKTLRKNGRQILAATESYEALIVMVLWMRRVQRIANKHKKARDQQYQQENQQGPGIMGMIVPDGVIPESEVYGNGTADGQVSRPGTGLGYPSHPIARPGFSG